MTDLAAVSKSDPSPDASIALDACSITDTKGVFGKNGPLGIDLVVGMGQVPHARDAAKYVRLAGVEPEIQTDDPAWLIVVSGPIQLPLGPKMWDATCVYVDGTATWFITGNHEEDGKLLTPAPLPGTPAMALPALVP